MDRTLNVVLFLCFVALCLATNDHNSADKHAGEPGAKLMMKRGAKGDEDDAKVEVVKEGKDESAKDKKALDENETKKKDETDDKEQHEDQKSKKKSEEQDDHEEEDDEEEDEEDEHEDEEEVDPNAKIDVHDLFTPKDCVNKSKSGDLVVIHYTGWMDDGTLFDTTIDATKGYMPFEFMLGTGTVIKGFERGVLDMCRGQKREIVIPPSLGYGKRGAGEIPGKRLFIDLMQCLLLQKSFVRVVFFV